MHNMSGCRGRRALGGPGLRQAARTRSLAFAFALALTAVTALSGCFLPIGTAAPQSAKTIGEGGYGTSLHAELPTINLVAEDEAEQGRDGDRVVANPSASMNFGFTYGLTNKLDLEIGVEGALLLFVVPIPTGLSGGVRYQAFHSDAFAIAVAARGGYVGISGSVEDSQDPDTDWSASARFGQFTAVGQLSTGPVRPLIALSAMPLLVDSDLPDQNAERFTALAATATVGATFVAGTFQLTPFGALTYFGSPEIDGVSTFSVGVSFAFRPDKHPWVELPPGPGR
jgi:hypothetical protein